MNATTAAILVIGDEILSGKTDEQNARFLIRELHELGVSLRRILTISDDIEEVAEATKELSSRYDHVFTSGGVGPTHDDVTIVGIAQAFDVPIVRHPELEERLRKYFGDDVNESRLRMADVPKGAELIQAEDLKWPVLVVRNVYVLPGVPDLFRRKFLAIRERFRIEPFYAHVVYTHEDEFDIAAQLQEIAENHPLVAIGSYPNFETPEYRVKLTLESKDAKALEAAWSDLLNALNETRVVRHE
ncbi:MAG TPA: molybdopterin-binding protein [Blastocatellia bacterium]|nr:molybdopterin-binding protein [Blastocatellia bacterium]